MFCLISGMGSQCKLVRVRVIIEQDLCSSELYVTEMDLYDLFDKFG